MKTQIMDFQRKKGKKGIENCRFLFIRFLIVCYALSHTTEKCCTISRKQEHQGNNKLLQISLTMVSNNLRKLSPGKEKSARCILLLWLLQSAVFFFQNEMPFSSTNRTQVYWWNQKNVFHPDQTKVFCCLKQLTQFSASKHLYLLNIFTLQWTMFHF